MSTLAVSFSTPLRPPGCRRPYLAALLLTISALMTAIPLQAQDPATPSVTVGAGMRTSYAHNMPDGADSTDTFALDSVRLYVSGTAAKKTKFMFNTEYDPADNKVGVLDAAAQFELSDKVNIWVGRMLPPSDRANLYGPYYAHHWAVYTDGVQDGYPFIFQGRDNGLLYWGQFGILKASGGIFDGASVNHTSTLISAGRVQLDFWDPEAGYYLNGTYYGDKNLLAVGAAGQVQGDNNAWNVDFLLERKVSGGAVTIEAQYAKYDRLGGYDARYGTDDGGYVLASYLFPPLSNMAGRFEILGKFAKANFSNGLTTLDADYNQKTTELNFNYVIKQFNARVMFYYLQKDFSAVQANDKRVGVGFQLQM